MGTTVGDLLSLQNGSFGTVKIYNRRELFDGVLTEDQIKEVFDSEV